MGIASIKNPNWFAKGELPPLLLPLLSRLLRIRHRRYLAFLFYALGQLWYLLLIGVLVYATYYVKSECPPFFNYIPVPFLLPLILIASGALFGISGWREYILRIAKSLNASDAKTALTNDSRPPVLYLRSFASELTYDAGESAEESIAATSKAIGPLIAIGQPGEVLPPVGAARIYLEVGEEWQSIVEEYLRKAQLVIIRAEYTQGLLWEIVTAFGTCAVNKIVITIPFPDFYDDFRKAVVQATKKTGINISLPEKVTGNFMYFDQHGTAGFAESLGELLIMRGVSLDHRELARPENGKIGVVVILSLIIELTQVFGLAIYAFAFPFILWFVSESCGKR